MTHVTCRLTAKNRDQFRNPTLGNRVWLGLPLPFLCCLLVYIVCFPTYPFFLHFFLIYLLPYLSFPLRIDPLRFQAGCRKRRLNLALFRVCLFRVVRFF